jgi:hypothetical protein
MPARPERPADEDHLASWVATLRETPGSLEANPSPPAEAPDALAADPATPGDAYSLDSTIPSSSAPIDAGHAATVEHYWQPDAAADSAATNAIIGRPPLPPLDQFIEDVSTATTPYEQQIALGRLVGQTYAIHAGQGTGYIAPVELPSTDALERMKTVLTEQYWQEVNAAKLPPATETF